MRPLDREVRLNPLGGRAISSAEAHQIDGEAQRLHDGALQAVREPSITMALVIRAMEDRKPTKARLKEGAVETWVMGLSRFGVALKPC